MLLRATCLIALPLLPVFSHADVRPSSLFSDNAVLQRDIQVPVWGWGDPGEKVAVTFAGQTVTTQVDKEGRWMTNLKSLEASAESRVMKINELEIKNVVVGDVWICSGQSNMEWGQAGTLNAADEPADFAEIRHVKIAKEPALTKRQEVKIAWTPSSAATVRGFTGVGFYFGRRLHRELDVPIGLLNASWGGTRIEPWTARAGFESQAGEKFADDNLKRMEKFDPKNEETRKKFAETIEGIRQWATEAEAQLAIGISPDPLPAIGALKPSQGEPTQLYSGMIHPLKPYGIRGVIWYQGESNGSEGDTYRTKLQTLVASWREAWGQGDFPFYWVQLTNYGQPNNKPEGGDGFAKNREAMRQALGLIPNSGMAVAIDIGNPTDIHPKNKQDVGRRLAQWALSAEYGKQIVPSGPLYRSHEVINGKIRVEFAHVGTGLMAATKDKLDPPEKAEQLKQFAIAGADKKWHWAEAVIEGDAVVVSSPEVPDPVAVRYAFRGSPEGPLLYNQEGLPASPFRTDDW